MALNQYQDMNTLVSNAKSDNYRDLKPWPKKRTINADLHEKPVLVKKNSNSLNIIEKVKSAIQRPGTGDRRYHRLFSEL